MHISMYKRNPSSNYLAASVLNPPSSWHLRCCNSGILITPPTWRFLMFCIVYFSKNQFSTWTPALVSEWRSWYQPQSRQTELSWQPRSGRWSRVSWSSAFSRNRPRPGSPVREVGVLQTRLVLCFWEFNYFQKYFHMISRFSPTHVKDKTDETILPESSWLSAF